ncbi:hypothetical protein PMZ80_001418 [Knufia obscura]|uniref:Uncharacterized protein n=2 Tax=Knufia TaxID=430999 RepID=A0AAN8EPU3_9EURO|nr:hypothetical protein PMZ80_001418 [Knufia obscura]KAK5956183.1 hypothetical protein OHC33_002757 [Knufia fluminis]
MSQQSYVEDLRNVTQQIKARSEAHPQTTNDQDIVDHAAQCLITAKPIIQVLKLQKHKLNTKSSLQSKYKWYCFGIIDATESMVKKMSPPLIQLSNHLRSATYEIESSIGNALKGPIDRYMLAFEERGCHEKMEAEDEESDVRRDCQAVAMALHEFCNVLPETCMRAFKVTGKNKESMFGAVFQIRDSAGASA